MFESLKKWWATKPWTRIIPWAPALSFGKAKEWYEETKDSVIDTTAGFLKKISLPLFLLIVLGIIILIFWKKIIGIFK